MNDDRALAEAIRRHEERLARDPESLAFAQLADLYRKAGRTGDAVGASGTGLLGVVLFDAIAPGPSTFMLSGVATTPEGTPVPLMFGPASVVVR